MMCVSLAQICYTPKTTSTIVPQQPDREQIFAEHADVCLAAGIELAPLGSQPANRPLRHGCRRVTNEMFQH